MSIPAFTTNNVKIYNVTGYSHHNLPEWLVKKHVKKLKKDAEWRQRVQLIQDFEFPEASLSLQYTPDGQYIVATGVYKPQFRVYDLAEMAMKFERHTAAETLKMEILSEDWKKLVLLQSDRSVEFHSPLGMYHSARLPKMGRDMTYDYNTCDMLVGASSSQVYRLNLDRGQFMAPFETDATGINAVRVAPLHSLYGFAGDQGLLEFWDRRQRERIGKLTVCSADDDEAPVDLTALHFLPDGIHWAAGTADGRVVLFDLRSSKPIAARDHHNGFPIKKLDHHAHSGNLVSADKKSIKIWNQERLLTTIEPAHDLNDFCLGQDSGLILSAVEEKAMAAYFVPALGPAPRWCSFLENLTEEMEEKAPQAASVYDNYKFVTKAELAALGLDHLVGTGLLRAYMHGYFVDLRLYEKAKSIANPFAYEEYRDQQRAAKLEKERASRIRAVDASRPSAKVNSKLASRLQAAVDHEGTADSSDDEDSAPKGARAKKNERRAKKVSSILTDSRFGNLFNDPDFTIDEASAEFRHHHPSGATN